MDMRKMTPEVSGQMSVPTPAPDYPLRRLARFLGVVGAGMVAYAGVLIVLAWEAAIIEF